MRSFKFKISSPRRLRFVWRHICCFQCRKTQNHIKNPLAMVDFVLNDLRRPAGERLDARLELLILPLHLDGLIPLCFPRANQGQVALLRVIRRGFLTISGLNMTMYAPTLSNAMMRLLTPIMFAAMPTQPFLCAASVSNKSCAMPRSSAVAGSGFQRQKIRLCRYHGSWKNLRSVSLYYCSREMRKSQLICGSFGEEVIFAPAADIPRSSQNARPRHGYGGDSGDNPGRKCGRFLKTSGSGLHRQMDIQTHKRRGIGWSVPCPRGQFAWRNRHHLCKTGIAPRDFAVPLPWLLLARFMR